MDAQGLLATTAAAAGLEDPCLGPRLHGGHTACLYRVHTRTGDLVLRLRRDRPQAERLAWEADLLDHLSGSGFPCPRVIRARDGSLAIQSGDATMQLLTHIEHDSTLDDHDETSHRLDLSRLLAHLHGATAGYRPSPQVPEWSGNLPVAPRAKYLDGPLGEGITRYRDALGARSPEARILEELAQTLYREFRTLEKRWGDVPPVVIHNDLCGNNVLLLRDSVAGLVDWDFALTGPFLVDVAEALFGIMIWDGSQMGCCGLPQQPLVRWREGREFLDYYARAVGFEVDLDLCLRFLVIKIISMIMYPGIDLATAPGGKAASVLRARQLVDAVMAGPGRD